MKGLGGFTYRLAGLLVLLRPGSLADRVGITVDDQERLAATSPVHGVFVTNGTKLGSGMTLPVESRIDDGILEVVWINATSRPGLLWAFACLVNGWRIPDGVISVVRGTHAVISCADETTIAADGEVIDEGTRFEVTVRPGALRVIAPPAR